MYTSRIQINQSSLIQSAFSQVLDEAVLTSGSELSEELRAILLSIFSEQEAFSKVRHIDNASAKLRFRIMTEVAPQGNIFNAKFYPEILEDTLNFVLPLHLEEDELVVTTRLKLTVGEFF